MSFVRAGSGEPVLLLHGFTLSHHVWRGVFKALAAEYDVVALTMPGHWGGSRLRWRAAGVSGMADGVERELDALEWGSCHIVGNALGGQVGFALERRGRARSLVAINGGVGAKRFDRSGFRLAMEFVRRYPVGLATRILGDRAAGHPRFQRRVLATSSRDPGAVHPADAMNMMRAISLCPTYIPSSVAFLIDGLVIDIDQVRAPTSLLLSEFDPYPSHAPTVREILDRLPDTVRVVPLPGVGHVPMLEAPDLVSCEIRAHLAGVIALRGEPGGQQVVDGLGDR
ncbi:alpha/beta fold hydrolase [Nocardia sp. NPDC052566]|uniref:alpha/beta fold hydrolase n=1 Tax=Nocardia sp. NPDC052566 TaxID=3364330 RepID=UPI0037C69BF0